MRLVDGLDVELILVDGSPVSDVLTQRMLMSCHITGWAVEDSNL